MYVNIVHFINMPVFKRYYYLKPGSCQDREDYLGSLVEGYI